MVTKRTGRPRGRPPGAKNIPRIEAFVADSLVSPLTVKLVAKPKGAVRGPWAKMTPEERTAYAKSLAARSAATGKPRRPSRRGKARHLTNAEHDAVVEAQRPVVDQMIRKLGQRGELPEDPRAVEALKALLLAIRSPGAIADRTAAARVILDFTKSKPTTRSGPTVKSAEDWVDELLGYS